LATAVQLHTIALGLDAEPDKAGAAGARTVVNDTGTAVARLPALSCTVALKVWLPCAKPVNCTAADEAESVMAVEETATASSLKAKLAGFTPEPASAKLTTAVVEEPTVLALLGETMAIVGAVVSIFTKREVVALKPLASVIVPATVVPVVWLAT
jgi:hypothetical protein